MVHHFSRRQINTDEDTYKDDQKLVALHRVASRFVEMLRESVGYEDVYLVGIWKGDFPRALVWSVEVAAGGVNSGTDSMEGHQLKPLPAPRWRRSVVARAPTWSWAAIEGPVHYPEPSSVSGHKGEFHPDAAVIEASVVCVDETEPFGQAVSGKLVLRGRLVHGLGCRKHINGGDTRGGGGGGGGGDPIAGHRCRVQVGRKLDGSVSFVCDVAIAEEKERMSCLYLGKGRRKDLVDGDGVCYYAFLLLKEVEGGHGKIFERVGISSRDTGEDDADKILEMAEEDCVEIV